MTPERSMTLREKRLVASLTVLRDNLAPVVDQITAGHFKDTDALKLASVLDMIIRDLRPAIIPPDDAGDAGGR